ncbi:protein rep [Wenyingzhuangia marina]|uniref:Uncharacterized protein n=1 Tax=Wenyingzhuangia marina TaxID=1195760 RepID=A0A1M5S5A5_9FLAO|nr:protein rep [Wenyingzhuangia marina]GGF78995.1 hypothetical protein GCM10011397_22550 [Wenyingzhuangia marina]SHH33812.1 hypothetical protein SAMN05444281_0139 [Wenyingzhuangia marina]
MILSLIDITKAKGESERAQAYWNAYHCQSKIISSDNKLYGNYCKNRFCTVCCAIRKAEIINKYYPVLKEWEKPYFVTLTTKAVKAKNLNKWIFGMNRAFNIIKNRCKKRYQRGTGIQLIGVKSLECNFNPQRKTYNPHFHIIVPNKVIADLLKKEWMLQWNQTGVIYTSPKAQHIREVENLERDLIETIKYGSKIFTEADLKKKGKKATTPLIYALALDNILCAMKGKRIFERFGFNLPKTSKKKPIKQLVINYEEFIFTSDATDWISTTTGKLLTGYTQTSQLNHLLNECINTETY